MEKNIEIIEKTLIEKKANKNNYKKEDRPMPMEIYESRSYPLL